ncbi:DUF1192 domain-containing protein [Novosphingobium sp. P6W]|jgi:uncharacterized small protein (DUF1192 family)|uniref:DUF1192 domain-containing protein n=1 Tax=Novosphingobium sp. P6W TaxID=1609758 RepID=UPI0005C2AE68|nr:DUF1192 domain-containing protein [Novosphingobium sp. P6W]AXB75157.1 DUF1192 domain-containing protein [Novosphingobium sp. P6W]KIS32785.1 hypothetical protein TQ38_10945 [Novosphingobium sp. P6W]
MDEDDRPLRRSSEGDFGAASRLAGESLERYSLDELDARVVLLEAEIERIRAHKAASSAHRLAADALFRPRSS